VIAIPTDTRPATAEEQAASDLRVLQQFYPDISASEVKVYNEAAFRTGEIAQRIQNQFPQFFYGYRSNGTNPYSAVLNLKAAPQAVLDLVEQAKVPGLTVVNDYPINYAEQLKLTSAALDPVITTNLTEGASAVYDPQLKQMQVQIDPKPGIALDRITSGLATTTALGGILDVTGRSFSVPIKYSEFTSDSGTVMTGGAALSRYVAGYGDTRAVCTIGFATVGQVGSGAGKRGMLGAEHCESPLAYEASNFLDQVIIYDGSVKADARMFIGRTTNNQFRDVRRDFINMKSSSGALLTKPALYRQDPGDNAEVCLFGTYSADDRSRGRENCDRVRFRGQESYFQVTSGTYYRYYNQTQTINPIAYGGDSGGPWFYGNTAFGLQSAACVNSSGAFTCAKFQPISDVERKTGSRALTN